MSNAEESLERSFGYISKIYGNLSNEDKAQFLSDCCAALKKSFDMDVTDRVLFKGFEELLLAGEKLRWKPSYLIITISSYETKDITRVLRRLRTFAKKKKFEIEELDVGEDMPDTYVELALHMMTKWETHKLIFDSYIDKEELFDFLEQFPEIEIGDKK